MHYIGLSAPQDQWEASNQSNPAASAYVEEMQTKNGKGNDECLKVNN